MRMFAMAVLLMLGLTVPQPTIAGESFDTLKESAQFQYEVRKKIAIGCVQQADAINVKEVSFIEAMLKESAHRQDFPMLTRELLIRRLRRIALQEQLRLIQSDQYPAFPSCDSWFQSR